MLIQKNKESVPSFSRTICRLYLLAAILTLVISFQALGAENKVKYLNKNSFTYKDSSGITWYCCELIRNDKMGAAIYGCDNAGPELKIPAKVTEGSNKWPVTDIVSHYTIFGNGMDRFSYNEDEGSEDLGILHFPDSVVYIGEDAFNASWDWDGGERFLLLYEIYLPNNKDLTIGGRAFSGCGKNNGLPTEVTFGSSPVKIGYAAFSDCTGLQSLTLPKGIAEQIHTEAFSGCCNLEKITNAPAQLNLGEGTQKLKTVVFDPTLKHVEGIYGEKEVDGEMERVPLTSLTSVTLPDNCTEISSGAFKGNSNLTTINKLNWSQFEFIGDEAFAGCKKLKLSKVDWPLDSLEYQFMNSGLESITLPSNLTEVYGGSFAGCTNLKSINVASGCKGFFSKDGILYTYIYDSNGKKDGTSILKYPAGKSSASSYTIPTDVAGLDGFAFNGCRFTEIHVPITLRILFESYMASIEGDSTFGRLAFDNMSTKCPIYYVPGSYTSESIEEWYGSRAKKEYGPQVKITYNLAGGTNNSGNPATFTAGKSITLKNPSRTGYTFDGWESGVLSKDDIKFPYYPEDFELTDGVKFYATWKKNGDSNKDNNNDASVTPAASKPVMTVTIAKDSYAFTGKSINPDVTVMINGKTLSKSDYTVVCKNNKAIGKAGLTVTGKGAWANISKSVSFKIVPKKVKIKKPVSKKKKTVKVTWKKNSKKEKVTKYEIQLSMDKTFTEGVKKKTVKASKKTLTVKKLKSKKTYYVRIRAFKKVGKNKYYGDWSKVKAVKVK